VYVAIASYCEKRHAYRDRCEIRHGRSREEKNNNNNISVVIYYLKGGTGDDDEEELTFDVVGFEGLTDVIGKFDDICRVNCCCCDCCCCCCCGGIEVG
jgi:hypothetical protein